MTDNEALSLIEFARNRAADSCQSVTVTHFAEREQWLSEGDVDPLEIEAARGGDAAATECCNLIQRMDCHAIFMQWVEREAPPL